MNLLYPYSYFKRKLIDNILWQNNSYTKFIVLTAPRTGSNYLLSKLNSHPNSIIFGELFNPTNVLAAYYGWPYPLYNKEHKSFFMALREKNPEELLNNYIFRTYSNSIRAVGFKMFYYHCQDNGIWTYLKSIPNLKIIHLIRANILEMYVSYEIAKAEGLWKSKEISYSQISIKVDPRNLLKYINTIENQKSFFSDYFKENPVFKVKYKELFTKATVNSLQSFLELPDIELSSDYVKQNPKPLSSKISNYSEIVTALKGTKWQVFLDED